MNTNLTPVFDYLLCEEVKKVSGAVTPGDVEDHWQKYKVLAVGPGRWIEGTWIDVEQKPDDIIYVMKHAEADTPPELKQRGLALIMASRVMAKEGK